MPRTDRTDRAEAQRDPDDLDTGQPTWVKIVALVIALLIVLTLVASALFA